MSSINFLDALSTPQWSVVQSHDGPILVISGPGSGKTRTLTYRVAHMVLTGISPEQILLLTFTRKAAQEMLSRVDDLLPNMTEGITGGTFHGVAQRVLCEHYTLLHFEHRPTILSQGDALDLLRFQRNTVKIERPDLQQQGIKLPDARNIQKHLSALRNAEKDVEEQIPAIFPECPDAILWVCDLYHHAKQQQCLLDYDDLLFKLRTMLQNYPNLCQYYSEQFRYIMIDEYQDTNPVQHDIALLLASEHDNIMVVGDESQSIYKFRGATIQNILEFQKDFPHAKVLRLEDNYRSTKTIVSALNRLLTHATEKLDKTLRSVCELEDLEIEIVATHTGQNQAQWVVQKITSLHNNGTPLHDIAVLYRSTYHGNLIDMACTHAGLKFVKWGGQRFAEAAHVRDMLSILRVRVNPRHQAAWMRIFALLSGVGPKTGEKILAKILESPAPYSLLAMYPGKQKWVPQIQGLGQMLETVNPDDALDTIFETAWSWYELKMRAYPRYHKDLDFRMYGMQQFKQAMITYEDLRTFLDEFTVNDDGEPQKGADDHLVLSTIHSAKGKEFLHVFIPELVEGALPDSRALEDEEELRLFYVALSRAKQGVYLSYPKSRVSYSGGTEVSTPSRFLGYVCN